MAATPTTTRRAAPVGRRTGFASARMLEAQRAFQHVVKHELQLLLSRGTTREDAVKLLLGRIVASTEPPDASAVRGVMRQFQMNYDDAVRALIVKQELGRLKRQGLDSFAAIEELTRKMKSREDETEREAEREEADEEEEEDVMEQGGEKEEEREEENGGGERGVDQHRDVGRERAGGEEEEKEESGSFGTGAAADGNEDSGGQLDVARTTPLAADAVCVTVEKEGSETTSLSLCQRIGQVSISSVTTPEQESDDSLEVNGDLNRDANEEVAGTRNKTGFRSPSRVESSSSSTFVELAPQPRKRRAAFDEHFDTVTHSRSNSSERNVKPMFPGRKKQKLCADVGDSFLHIVTRKSKPMLSSSPKGTAVKSPSGPAPGGGKGGGGSTRSERSSKNLLKRQRASPTGMADNDESPIADEPRASHPHHRHHVLHHHSKRQKSGSPH